MDDILAFLAPIRHPERLGKPNAQITYTDDEIQVAKLAGKYTTEDGYIFDPRDITSDEGDAYVTPHMTHSHWIKKIVCLKLRERQPRLMLKRKV
ncbi:histidine triad domain protein [Streptococcus pneumoniae GA13723]|nr:histidine triad domain protein [Streptococcus pneumoniae GA13723]